MTGRHGGNYARRRFGKLREFLCTQKFHFLSGGVGWDLIVKRKSSTKLSLGEMWNREHGGLNNDVKRITTISTNNFL